MRKKKHSNNKKEMHSGCLKSHVYIYVLLVKCLSVCRRKVCAHPDEDSQE